MGRTWDRGVLAGVVLLTALLVFNAALTYQSIRRLNEDAGWVAHTHEVLDLIDGVLLALVDAETGERGYLLTGQDPYLEPYERALPRLGDQLSRLDRETADNPGQQDRVRELRALVSARLALLEERIDLRRRKARDPDALAAGDKGRVQMASVRDLVAELKQNEERLLRDRVRQSDRAYRAAVTTGLLTAAAGLAAVGAFVWLVRRSLAARQRAAAAVEQQREWLRVTLASIGDAVIVTDTGGRVVLLNPVAATLTGWTQEEAQRQPLEKVFPILNEHSRQPVESPVARVLREGTVVGLANHTVLTAKDGTERPVDDSAAPIRDARGNTLGVVLTFRDVTERRRAEETSRRLAAIVESSDDAIVGKTLDGVITSWNRGAERLYGYTAGEMTGKPFTILVPEDRADELAATVERLRRGESLEHFETVRRRKDGGLVEVSMSYSPVRDGDGRLSGVSVIARDVTERKRAEAAVREAEARLGAIVHHSPACVFAKDPRGRYLLANRALARLVGREPEDFPGRTDADFFPPEVAEQFHRDDVAVFASGRPRTYEESFPHEGVTRTYLTVKFPLRDAAGAAYGVCAIATDITALKASEAALREEARVNETLYRIGKSLAAELDPQKVVQTVTDEATALTGARYGAFFYNALNDRGESYLLYTLAGAPREAFAKFPVPRNTELFEPTFRGLGVVRLDDVTRDPRYGKNPPYHGMPEGHLPVRSYLAAPVVSRSGDVLGGLFFGHPEVGVFTGRHERLVVGVAAQAAVALDNARLYGQVQESEQRFRQLAENIREVFWMSDPAKSEILYVSPAYEEVWGRPCVSLYRDPLSFFEAIHPDDREHVRVASLERQRRGEPSDVEYRVVRPDGSFRWVRDRGFPIRDASGRAYRAVGIAEDVTERRRAADALREADRRKDEFLAMLAHELRNPLAPIRNALHLLKLPGADARVGERARGIMERQVEHMVRLVDDLLDVSRIMRDKIDLRREPIDLATVVARAVETAQPALDAEGHELTVSLPAEPLRLDGDLVRLAQVVSNLLHNAAKYTERGGKIALAAERRGDEAVLRVRDNGIGVSPELLPRIFDMFVQAERRTRDARGGLGIGLTLVRRLVEMHGGSIEARSDGPGTGSEFVVRLPLLPGAATGDRPPVPAAGPPAGKPAPRRVLVADDNPDAADSLAMMLRLQGHDVRVAYGGRAALEQARSEAPDVALLDLGMPVLDGYELAKQFREDPCLRQVLLVAVTGWGQTEDRRRTQEAGFHHHLVKPVEAEALEKVLADLRPNPA